MKYLSLIYVMLLIVNISLAQPPERSLVPIELYGEKIYLEKLSEISLEESIKFIEPYDSTEKDEVIKRIHLYNLVLRKKINQEINKQTSNIEVKNLKVYHQRSLNELKPDSVRFVLKCDISPQEFVQSSEGTSEYYIYDTKSEKEYAPFYNLEVALKTLKAFQMLDANEDDFSQEKVDIYTRSQLPAEPRIRPKHYLSKEDLKLRRKRLLIKTVVILFIPVAFVIKAVIEFL